MHSTSKFLLNCIEYILNRPINRIIWSTVDKAVASRNDHLCNDRVPVGDQIVHEETPAALRSSLPNIIENLLDKVHEKLQVCPRA